jgi:hypothetical protein
MKMKRHFFWILSACLAGWATPSLGSAQRTDVLVLSNGDAITGEVRELTQGYLKYKTDDAGLLEVKWLHVQSLSSIHTFEVELVTGDLIFGDLKAPAPGRMGILTAVFPLEEIVAITPIRSTVWGRTFGHLDVGLDFSKADHRFDSSLDGELNYRSRRWGGAAEADYYVQNQDDADRFSRGSISMELSLFLGRVLHRRKIPVWAGRIFWKASSNDELSIDLQNTVGIGARRRLWHTNRVEATADLGVVKTRESYVGEDDPYNSVEILLASSLDIFKLDSPKLTFDLNPRVFFSATEGGRVRGSLDARFQYEIFGDFYAGLSGNLTLDNNPQSVSATTSKSDYSVNFTIGYSWW